MADGYLSIEDVLALPRVGSPRLSPDGSHLAFVRTEADFEDKVYRDRVFLHHVQTGRTYPLTPRGRTSTAPAFSPDSSMLAVLGAGQQRRRQVFVHNVGESILEQVTHASEGVRSFWWSHDGAAVFYTAPPRLAKGRRRRRDTYGDYEHVDVEHRRWCVWRLDLQTGLDKLRERGQRPPQRAPKPTDDGEAEPHEPGARNGTASDDPAQRLTDPDQLHVTAVAVSPDGSRLALVAAPTPDMDHIDERRLYLLDLGTGQLEPLDIAGRQVNTPHFSPDGTRLAFTRPGGEGRWTDNAVLQVLDLSAGTSANLLAHVDESIAIHRYTSAGILCSWQDRTRSTAAIVAEDGSVRPLESASDEVQGAEHLLHVSPSVSADGDRWAAGRAHEHSAWEIVLDGRAITRETDALPAGRRARKRVVSWTSLDGVAVEGVLSVPDTGESPQRAPLVVVVHGGPTGVSVPLPANHRLYPIDSLVEKGFIVLEPNYRGSAGYGAAFRSQNFRDLGLGDYADVVSGVDALVEQGLADPDRVGVMGWSQGGYISAFCLTYGADRFKAVSVGAGISNWTTYYVNTDIHPFTRHYLDATPWDDPEIYAKTSPITYVKQASAPTLIQHGERDARVPIPNAYELYQGLRDNGVPVELVVFKGMGHGPTSPNQARAIMRQNLLWFSHHLLGEPLGDFRLDDDG